MEKVYYLTVLSDGSSDIAAIENEIVYVHYAFEGKMFTAFADLVAKRRLCRICYQVTSSYQVSEKDYLLLF